MRHERQVELLKRVQANINNRPTPLGPHSMINPASAYADPERFQKELRVLFRGRPALVAFSCDVARPGDWVTASLGGVELIIVRQPDMSLKAHVNACRHRAAPLLAGRGEGLRYIQCPYHAWTFTLEGDLKARPGTGSAFDDIPAENCALHGVEVAEHHGLVFARIAGDGPMDAASAMQGAEGEIADYGLEGYVHFDTRTAEWNCNWKLILDTFTESYHIPWLHKETIAPLFSYDQMIVDQFGTNPRAIGLRKSVNDEFAKASEADWDLIPHATIQYFMLPNALVVYQLDHVEVWRVEPLAVDRTRVHTSLYAPEAPKDDKGRKYWSRNLDILLQVTGTEDFPTMEGIQRNLSSGMVPNVVYGKLESGLVGLHESINRLLDEA